MNILIIEDEELAAEHLANLIKRIVPEVNTLHINDSIESSVKWFTSNPAPDLIFMDIQLGDGLSFEIFEKSNIKAPVIFTTAYEEYAIKAFKVNSIDYLLKPISPDDLSFAINKFKEMKSNKVEQQIEASVLEKVKQMLNPKYKERFVIKVGEHIKSVPTNEINYFYSSSGSTYLCNQKGSNYILDNSLEELEKLVDPLQYFRINRKYIINLEAITDMVSFSSSRIKIKLANCSDDDVIVSRDKVHAFKAWLDR